MRLRDHKRPYKHEDACQSGDMDHGKILELIWEDVLMIFVTINWVYLESIIKQKIEKIGVTGRLIEAL